MLSCYLANPCVKHLKETLHVFVYLKCHNKSTVVFDHTTPKFDMSRFTECDPSEVYPGVKEEDPPNAPELHGQEVHITCFVDADCAGCHKTPWSHTGIIIYMQRMPIVWYSKRQDMVESSTFGSKFVAMKMAVK